MGSTSAIALAKICSLAPRKDRTIYGGKKKVHQRFGDGKDDVFFFYGCHLEKLEVF